MSLEHILRIVAIILGLLHFYFLDKLPDKRKAIHIIAISANVILLLCIAFADAYFSLKGAQ